MLIDFFALLGVIGFSMMLIIGVFLFIWCITGVFLNPKCNVCGKARVKDDGFDGYKCPHCGAEGRYGSPC